MMANMRAKILKGLLDLKLCPVGKRIMNASVVPGGGGPKAFEPHMAECETCRRQIEMFIDALADDPDPA